MKPLLLMILDGWGHSPQAEGNAIANAQKPSFNTLFEEYPHTFIVASGEEVGLPPGQMGNSEVGHLNIGAGRVVYQEFTRISKAIRTGEFAQNTVLKEAMERVKDGPNALHLMGLLSDGGVHSHSEHLFALLDMAKAMGVKKVFIHALLDGRDVLPQSAKVFMTRLNIKCKELGLGKVATVSGRYYTMDRDKRWERVEKGYRALVDGEGLKAPNPLAAIEQSYDIRVTDEFVAPTVIVDSEGKAVGTLQDGDSFIFFNFRSDRAREISYALVNEEFTGFERGKPLNLHYVCMTEYDDTLKVPVAFPAQNLDNTLGEVLAKHKKKQLRIAETEKYAHVTFFFNGGVEDPCPGETRCLIPSPKVATYNLKPEMSAYEITEELLKRLDTEDYDIIILNFANSDMVGHTGEFGATVKAIEAVDECIGKIVPKILERQGTVIITADHGNAEAKVDLETGQPLTAHTSNPVPFILVNDDLKGKTLREGGALRDVAPTALELMGIPQPQEMTGTSLIL
ncbi:phosphoglycerate mutase [Desulfitobacterium dehalogenans ATCC 51507]|uniref:2,3-bisphosphoglycerate-independent phosphoglycerate mutase n=1 Tax=Desulfitobacterium dehalogenans (strain ATCC 51507 / DSM 9161 / JW/IU-DC1) TaxID=756499 RepID=I4AEA8_DESDJ|nr:2,3-bisphosphoglycerate-independent phosphoglycerate mutase [Desulfitobacterium dehalogenans]AFM02293.1 phosphoglycerate mutase [Desulfitobacterium dehalogenans ATCC 51507]